MTIQFWRLSEAGESNLGPACTADGLLLGRTHLIERRDGRFVVRARGEIQRLFGRAYHDASAVERIMSGLGTVAAALDGGDLCLACIAAVHLRIPDLPDFFARGRMEAEDTLIKYARGEEPDPEWDPAKHPRTAQSRLVCTNGRREQRIVPGPHRGKQRSEPAHGCTARAA